MTKSYAFIPIERHTNPSGEPMCHGCAFIQYYDSQCGCAPIIVCSISDKTIWEGKDFTANYPKELAPMSTCPVNNADANKQLIDRMCGKEPEL